MMLKQFLLKTYFILIVNISKSPTHTETINNCSYENTVNITDYPKEPNGSYTYDNSTLIPANLVGTYDYEVLYDGSERAVSPHPRACLCHLKHCITLCSNYILEMYKNVSKFSDHNDMTLFAVNVTLKTGARVTKNIVKDFEHIILKEFCEASYFLSPQIDEESGWSLYENGSLLRHSDQVYLASNEYCFEVDEDLDNNEWYINPLNCAKKGGELKSPELVNNWTRVFSIPFFLLTLFAYACLPELRNIHGKCLMSYLSCLSLLYSLFSYINLSDDTFEAVPCIMIGYLIYYLELTHYTWLGIISYDTWQSFSDLSYKTTYSKYLSYGWLMPLLLTFFTFVAQNVVTDDKLKPGINEHRCGLDVNTWTAAIYLYGPCFGILVFCLTSFTLTSRIIKANEKDVLNYTDMRTECPKIRYTLYLRLFLLMGLSWFLDIISYLFVMLDMMSISFAIDFINATQGVYIFINFIGRRRVRTIIKERLTNAYKSSKLERTKSMEFN